MSKQILSIAILGVSLLLLASPLILLAQQKLTPGEVGLGEAVPAGQADIGSLTGIKTTQTPVGVAAAVIRVILGFLGIVAVIIILIGGFKWMTAGGNEDKVTEARKLIVAGIIGLIIVIAAYAIANFVISNLLRATGVTTP